MSYDAFDTLQRVKQNLEDATVVAPQPAPGNTAEMAEDPYEAAPELSVDLPPVSPSPLSNLAASLSKDSNALSNQEKPHTQSIDPSTEKIIVNHTDHPLLYNLAIVAVTSFIVLIPTGALAFFILTQNCIDQNMCGTARTTAVQILMVGLVLVAIASWAAVWSFHRLKAMFLNERPDRKPARPDREKKMIPSYPLNPDVPVGPPPSLTSHESHNTVYSSPEPAMAASATVKEKSPGKTKARKNAIGLGYFRED